MPRIRQPRKGSMQFWPRKRAKRIHAYINTWNSIKDAKPLGFAGYKAGMTHVMAVDNKSTSPTKGDTIVIPVTVLECPPLKIAGIRCYHTRNHQPVIATQVWSEKLDKDLARIIPVPKKTKTSIDKIKPEDYIEFRLLVHTQPRLINLKKSPELFEVGLGGTPQQQLEYAKTVLGKDVKITDVFNAGQQVDSHSISKGKGTRGPVQRFGVALRFHKSEKTKRGPGSLGPWHGNPNWTVAHAGQTGFHQRTEHGKWIVQIGEDPAKINPVSGFLHYGVVRAPYVLIKGSVPGPAKRLIKLTTTLRANKHIPKEAPSITHVSLSSKQ